MVAPLTAAPTTPHVAAVQRRTIAVLCASQVIGGGGVAIGISVGALLAADLGGTGISGVAQSASVVGGALLVLPVTRLMQARGRRPGLALAYLAGGVGAVLIVVAARTASVPLLFLGMLFFGGGTAGNLQARYTAVDLAPPDRRGQQLSLVVWATTIGAVAGPNLAPLAGSVVTRVDLPGLSGPFVFSALAFAVAAGLLLLLLRPDPLLLSRRLAATPAASVPSGPAPDPASVDPARPAARVGMREALRAVLASPPARLGIAAVAMGHLVMVAVMSMTPVHIGEAHDSPAVTLRLVGLVLSVHIAGMYALSPIAGLLTDRWGRRPMILTGIALLLVACAVAGTAGYDTTRLAIGLTLLGLGWSATMVAGSTLLSESVDVSVRPSAQGLSDVVMGLAGASAAGLSGVVVQWQGYPVLALLAAITTVPLVALALRPVRVRVREGL